MLNNWKTIALVFIAGVSLGLIASVVFIRPSKRDIQKQLDWKDSTVRLNTELEYSKLERNRLDAYSDSLLNEVQKNGIKFDSIQIEINKYKRNGSQEIKSVRYWNDAKRDSFWRVEGSRR